MLLCLLLGCSLIVLFYLLCMDLRRHGDITCYMTTGIHGYDDAVWDWMEGGIFTVG